MKQYFAFFTILLLVITSSCREDFVFEPSSGNLRFSRDTIYLDTVFTNIGSSTYTLKVYNDSDKDIIIPQIRLGKGLDSKYRITVDGMMGNNNRIFEDVEFLAKDSMYIFIETTASILDANPTDFLYTDIIEFTSSNNVKQKVDLVTLIQDAVFLYPQRFDDGTTETLSLGEDEIYGFVLNENENGNEFVWTNSKPYVIYGYAGVPSGKTLTIQPGARVHFHDSSGIIVGNGGSLQVLGEPSQTDALEKEVIFEGDRLEPGFANIPGQWGLIWLSQGSVNNVINHLTLKNATVGLLVTDATTATNNSLLIKNTQIYNCANAGILSRSAKIEGENLVINNAGVAALACTWGGNYSFKHCTFNNNWPSSRQVAVLIDNYLTNSNNTITTFDLIKAEFKNCIIFGSNQIALLFDRKEGSTWNTPLFEKCQIKFNNNQLLQRPEYQFLNESNNIIRNGNPDFLNIANNRLEIGLDSDAKGFGNDLNIPFDLKGNARIAPFDLGAYNAILFEED